MYNLPSLGIGLVPHSLTPLRSGRSEGTHKHLDGKGVPFLCENLTAEPSRRQALVAQNLGKNMGVVREQHVGTGLPGTLPQDVP